MRHANHTLGRGQQLAKDQRSAALACTLEGGGMGEVADCDPSTGQGGTRA